VFVRWHKTAKYGFSTPYLHSGDGELGAFPIFQTVSEGEFSEVALHSRGPMEQVSAKLAASASRSTILLRSPGRFSPILPRPGLIE
jgi:hypothetical protein